MSVMNIVANILTPEYSAIYLVRTPLMNEAEDIGGFFRGEIHTEPSERGPSLPATKAIGGDDAELEDYSPAAPIGFLLCLIPLAIVGGLSSFHAQNSTAIERGFTMAWLIVGIFNGSMIYMLRRDVPSYSAVMDRHLDVISREVVVIITYGAPAVGGMVIVGKMIKEFGICKLLS